MIIHLCYCFLLFQCEIHNQLRSILQERNEKALLRMMHNFQSSSEDPDIADFISYFKENYVNTIEYWAYAPRKIS